MESFTGASALADSPPLLAYIEKWQREPVRHKRIWARRSLDDRLWSRVDKSGGPDACWLWQGAPDTGSGYGRIKVGQIKTQAHRLAFILTNGEIPKGKNVLHARGCSKLCCQPKHLRCGTQKDNLGDARAEKRLRKHLKPAEVCAIVVAVRDEKLNYRVAGDRFGVSPQSVFNIMTGKTWSKLTEIGKRRSRPISARGKVELRAVA